MSEIPRGIGLDPCPPILLIFFNRPNLATQVLAAVRRHRPARLYIAVDGPRNPAFYPNDASRCEECRRLTKTVDWRCEINTLFSETNQGCGVGVSRAISWFFKHEEAGIILEDDCLPADAFFPFCRELLEIYRDKNEVMSICGNTFGSRRSAAACGGYSYGFGRYAQVWGWASWRRAWNLYRFDPGAAAENPLHFRVRGVSRIQQKVHQDRVRSTAAKGGPDTWDYQWQFSVIQNGALVASPCVNLISNIGFGADATHTSSDKSPVAMLPTGTLEFPLNHPHALRENRRLNRIYADHMFGRAWKLRRKLVKTWLRGLFASKPAAQK
jgi:hypothetical protein